ncbi:HAD family phosphatase [Chloroflexia bacterium SDU3-3]|nr:HAD family phosphatase [Chloroflexia bacterium SDU3-3]
MTQIRCIALDLDGTLLGPDHQISAANASAIRDCLDAGIHVVLASGRSFDSMRPYGQALGLPELICQNGAAVGDVASDSVRARQLLQPDQVALVSGLLLARGIPFCLFGLREIVYLPGKAQPDVLLSYGEPMFREVPALTPQHIPDPVKLLAFCEASPCDDELRALTAPALDQLRTHRSFLEWMPPGVGKGAALAEVAARLGLSKEEVMSVGDSQNDISMFAVSGVSVAMASAAPDVAAHARYRTASNAEDGVALALRRFALGVAV